jgi:hypothetical protein
LCCRSKLLRLSRGISTSNLPVSVSTSPFNSTELADERRGLRLDREGPQERPRIVVEEKRAELDEHHVARRQLRPEWICGGGTQVVGFATELSAMKRRPAGAYEARSTMLAGLRRARPGAE